MNRGRTRAVLTLVAACLVATHLAAPAEAQVVSRCDAGPSEERAVSRKAIYGFGAREVVSLTSAYDGAAIQIGVIRPRVPAGRKVPVIALASPYLHALQTVDLRRCEGFLAENFVPQGYAVALIPVRGTGDSGGCFDLFGPGERADLDQAIRWLGTRPWSNGSVGMTGVSYEGGTPWEVAATGNRHLKTIVPVEGVPDVFDLLFGGGTPDWRSPGILSGVYIAENIGYADGRTPERNIQTNACPDYAAAEAASAHSFLTGDVDPFGYWTARRYVDQIVSRYRGSVLLVHGLQDWNVNPGSQWPLIEDLRKRGRDVKMILGQWGHTQPDRPDPPARRRDYADILLRWFDRYLKADRSTSTGPAVDVQDSEGRWRHEPRWPPLSREVLLGLDLGGGLTRDPSFEGSVILGPDVAHLQDPLSAQGVGIGAEVGVVEANVHEVCEQPTCAAFRTSPVLDDYRIAGIPRLQLSVTPLGPGGTISAFLYAEGKTGLRRIGWGQVDLRFPRGRGTPASVTPGARLRLDFPLQPLDAVVGLGERIVLMLSMGNAYNRLPSSAPAPVVLEVGNRNEGLRLVHPSPSRSQFFRPPH